METARTSQKTTLVLKCMFTVLASVIVTAVTGDIQYKIVATNHGELAPGEIVEASAACPPGYHAEVKDARGRGCGARTPRKRPILECGVRQRGWNLVCVNRRQFANQCICTIVIDCISETEGLVAT